MVLPGHVAVPTVTKVPLPRLPIVGEVVGGRAGGIGETSVPSAPFGCDPKTALKTALKTVKSVLKNAVEQWQPGIKVCLHFSQVQN